MHGSFRTGAGRFGRAVALSATIAALFCLTGCGVAEDMLEGAFDDPYKSTLSDSKDESVLHNDDLYGGQGMPVSAQQPGGHKTGD